MEGRRYFLSFLRAGFSPATWFLGVYSALQAVLAWAGVPQAAQDLVAAPLLWLDFRARMEVLTVLTGLSAAAGWFVAYRRERKAADAKPKRELSYKVVKRGTSRLQIDGIVEGRVSLRRSRCSLHRIKDNVKHRDGAVEVWAEKDIHPGGLFSIDLAERVPGLGERFEVGIAGNKNQNKVISEGEQAEILVRLICPDQSPIELRFVVFNLDGMTAIPSEGRWRDSD